MGTRRYTIHAPQLEGRAWEEARQELQRFLRYLMDANDGGQTGAAQTSAEVAALSDTLSNEASVRSVADVSLAQAISVLSDTLSIEIVDRVSADDMLSNALSVEIANRVSADDALSNVISAEVAARTSADDALSNTLSAEASVRSATDEALSNAISDEASVRGAADDVLSNAISAEVAARTSADDALSNAISALSDVVVGIPVASVTSNEVSALEARVSAVSDVASNALSVGTAASAAAAAASAAAAAASAAAAAASAAAAGAELHASTASAAATSADGHANAVSIVAADALSVGLAASAAAAAASAAAAGAEVHASTASAAATSVDGRATSLANAVSVVSAALAADILNLGSVAGARQRKHGFDIGTGGTALLSISYNASAKQVTLTPIGGSYSFWIDGTKFTKSAPDVSPAHGAGTGKHFFYYDAAGSLQVSTGAWGIRDKAVTPAALVFYNSGLSAGICFYEGHTADRWLEGHYNLHFSRGTQYINGLSLAGYTLSVDSDAAVTFSVAAGVIADEDIVWSVGPVTDGGPYTIFYRSGAAGDWTWTKTDTLPFKAGATYPQWNDPNAGGAGVWGLTELSGTGGGEWVNYYLCALTAVDGTEQVILIAGQTAYASLAAARNAGPSEIAFGTMPFEELKGIWQITYHARSTFVGTKKAMIEAVAAITSQNLILQTTGANVSVTSVELDAVSAQAASIVALVDARVNSVVSTLVSAADAHASLASLAATSVNSRIDSVVSAVISGIETRVSTMSGLVYSTIGIKTSITGASAQGLTTVIGAISTRLSALEATPPGSASVTSQEMSVADAALSARINSVLSAETSALSMRIQSVLSVDVSVISAKLDSVKGDIRSRTGVSLISGNALVDIVSMAVSVAAGGLYALDGALMYEKATSGGAAFGLSLPAMGAGGTFIEMIAQASATHQASAAIGASGMAIGAICFSAQAALNTAVVSVSVATINTMRRVQIKGMLHVGASNGSVQLMARGSVAGDSLSIRAGYFRAVRVG